VRQFVKQLTGTRVGLTCEQSIEAVPNPLDWLIKCMLITNIQVMKSWWTWRVNTIKKADLEVVTKDQTVVHEPCETLQLVIINILSW